MDKTSVLINLFAFVLSAATVSVESESNTGGGSNVTDRKENIGLPLFLTPFIESLHFEEGRRAARVPSFVSDPEVVSYAGYLTVNKTYNSNIFFWYFESEGNPDDDPTVVWLQGGPGSSSLFGLFNENGPYVIADETTASKRDHSWSRAGNLIFFDSPVGTGYSFTESESGFARDQIRVGDDLYAALVQLIRLFPNLAGNDLFITGESYAGKYVPAFGHAIHRRNEPSTGIKLSGLMIGNAWTDPINMLRYGDYLYQLGLIDDNGRREFHKVEKQAAKSIKSGDWKRASRLIDRLVGDETSLYYKYTGLTGYYNYYDVKSGDWEDYEERFVTGDYFRRAVHVGDRPYHDGSDVYDRLYEDVPKSVIKWVAELLKEYRVLFYNGQLDVICSYPLTVSYLTNMKWPLSGKYRVADRYIYRVGGQVAGYYKSVGRLTEVLIRDAGHMVPADRPEWALQLLTDFIYDNITRHGDRISEAAFKKHLPYHVVL